MVELKEVLLFQFRYVEILSPTKEIRFPARVCGQHLPKKRGIEVKTNFAPMQRFVWAQGFGVVTQGLTEYEVYKNTLSVTILRSVGIISNPQNPSRSTPAGPPLLTPEAQQLGKNTAEFSIGLFKKEKWSKIIKEVFPDIA